MKSILVTGSSGLIGSAVCRFFDRRGVAIHGLDNNQRAVFFGPEGDTRWNQRQLTESLGAFRHHEIDIRNRDSVAACLKEVRPGAIVHAAAQPSHDLAARMPYDDFDTNAVGTLNLLEAARQHCPEAPFVFMSTNKIYGDRPNTLSLEELDTRWDYADTADKAGISESMSIDGCLHSVFGASKAAADLMVQEYGRYFGMPTCCLRCGCLTGESHSGVELHGFLSYLIRCNLEGREYKVYGYKGKQVRDNLDACDVAEFVTCYIDNPRAGEVYNLGGGKQNTCSIIEAFEKIEGVSGIAQRHVYIEDARRGDHICYYSDLRKCRAHYPQWDVRIGLDEMFEGMHQTWRERLATGAVPRKSR
jgi:CDP-paratose 2-epimerase